MSLLQSQQSQLIIIDQQSRLGAAMPEADWQQVLRHSSRLLQAANALNIPVLLSEQYPKGLGATDAEIKNLLADNHQRFEKTEFSCCANAAYQQQLINNKHNQLILTGMETHVCVLQTAIEAMDSGFEVFVVEDAVCSRDSSHKHNALQRLRQAGVIITNHESVLFEWMRDARHEQFKFISSLLK